MYTFQFLFSVLIKIEKHMVIFIYFWLCFIIMNWYPLKLSCINHFSYNNNKTYIFDFSSANSICTFKLLHGIDLCGYGIFDIIVFAMYGMPLRSNSLHFFVPNYYNYDGSTCAHIEFLHNDNTYKISRFIRKDFSVVSKYYILNNNSFVELDGYISTLSSFECAMLTSIMFSSSYYNNNAKILNNNSNEFLETLQIILNKSIDINSLQTYLDLITKEFNKLYFLTLLTIDLQLSSDMTQIKCYITENDVKIEETFPCNNILVNFILYVILVYMSFGESKGWFLLSCNTFKKLNYKQLHIVKIVIDYLCTIDLSFVFFFNNDNRDNILCNNFYNISVV